MRKNTFTMLLVLFLSALLLSVNTVHADTMNNLTFIVPQQMSFPQAAEKDKFGIMNPAGTCLLDNGMYIALGNIYGGDDIKYTSGGKTYEGESSFPIVPALALVYKQDSWAGFFNVAVYQGGGSVKFNNGSPSLEGQLAGYLPTISALIGNQTTTISHTEFSGSSSTLGIGLGGSYKLNDMLSVAIGARFLSLAGSNKYNYTIDYPSGNFVYYEYEDESKATGYNGVFGINIMPMKELRIGLTYDTRAKLNVETKVKKSRYANLSGNSSYDALIALAPTLTNSPAEDSTSKARSDMPAIMKFGVQYAITQQLDAGIQINYAFNKGYQVAKNYGNDIEYFFGIRYAIMPALRISCGLQYDVLGFDTHNDSQLGPPENANHNPMGVGIGVEFDPIKDLTVTITYAYGPYEDARYSDGSKRTMTRQAVGLALSYKI